MLLLTFPPVHSISSELWLAFCSSYRIAIYYYFHSSRYGYVGDINRACWKSRLMLMIFLLQQKSRVFSFFFFLKKLMIILFSRSPYGSHGIAVYKDSFQGQTLGEPPRAVAVKWFPLNPIRICIPSNPRTNISLLNIASYYHQESHPTSNQAMELWWGGGAIGWNRRAAEEGQVYHKLCTSCIASDNISFFWPKLAWNYHTSMIR